MSTSTEERRTGGPGKHYDSDLARRLENSFTYHSPKDDQPARYVELRETAKYLAEKINNLVPNSREKSTAISKLEESIFWANAAIARNE
jgi:hypothetical protein